METSFMATRMAVGPSAAPIIPIAAASFKGKPIIAAKIMVTKIPSCAAPPKINNLGLVSKGPKSIMHPIPINRSKGIASLAAIPTWNKELMIPSSLITGDKGRLTKIAPKPIGSKSAGSISLQMAR